MEDLEKSFYKTPCKMGKNNVEMGGFWYQPHAIYIAAAILGYIPIELILIALIHNISTDLGKDSLVVPSSMAIHGFHTIGALIFQWINAALSWVSGMLLLAAWVKKNRAILFAWLVFTPIKICYYWAFICVGFGIESYFIIVLYLINSLTLFAFVIIIARFLWKMSKKDMMYRQKTKKCERRKMVNKVLRTTNTLNDMA